VFGIQEGPRGGSADDPSRAARSTSASLTVRALQQCERAGEGTPRLGSAVAVDETVRTEGDAQDLSRTSERAEVLPVRLDPHTTRVAEPQDDLLLPGEAERVTRWDEGSRFEDQTVNEDLEPRRGLEGEDEVDRGASDRFRVRAGRRLGRADVRTLDDGPRSVDTRVGRLDGVRRTSATEREHGGEDTGDRDDGENPDQPAGDGATQTHGCRDRRDRRLEGRVMTVEVQHLLFRNAEHSGVRAEEPSRVHVPTEDLEVPAFQRVDLRGPRAERGRTFVHGPSGALTGLPEERASELRAIGPELRTDLVHDPACHRSTRLREEHARTTEVQARGRAVAVIATILHQNAKARPIGARNDFRTRRAPARTSVRSPDGARPPAGRSVIEATSATATMPHMDMTLPAPFRRLATLTGALALALALALTPATVASADAGPSPDGGDTLVLAAEERERRPIAPTQRDQLGLLLYGLMALSVVAGVATMRRQLKGERPQTDGEFRWR
jgi:hypothetical protein